MKRVRIKDYKEFFKDIKKNKSLKEFSKKSNISYSCLKRWSRGENLIPEKIFLRLLGQSKMVTAKQIAIKIRSLNRQVRRLEKQRKKVVARVRGRVSRRRR